MAGPSVPSAIFPLAWTCIPSLAVHRLAGIPRIPSSFCGTCCLPAHARPYPILTHSVLTTASQATLFIGQTKKLKPRGVEQACISTSELDTETAESLLFPPSLDPSGTPVCPRGPRHGFPEPNPPPGLLWFQSLWALLSASEAKELSHHCSLDRKIMPLPDTGSLTFAGSF